MVICIKCGKEQTRRSGSECDYVGVKTQALKEHSWMDRGEFIDELRKKLFPCIRERIEEWRKKCANNLSLFTARMESYEKKLNELKAAHSVYLNEGLPRDVNKEIRRKVRLLVPEMIGNAIGVFIVFKGFKWYLPWIFPKFDLEIPDAPWFIFLPVVGAAVLGFFLVGKSVVGFLKAKRYAESQEFADELSGDWYVNNGYNKLVSTIKAEQDKWNSINNDLEWHISAAERALAGSDEELLSFYNMDEKTKHHYVEDGLYEGEW